MSTSNDESKYNGVLHPYVQLGHFPKSTSYEEDSKLIMPSAAVVIGTRLAYRVFSPLDLMDLYNFPGPANSQRVTVAVISFGGGLFGTVDSNGNLSSGDCISYWRSLGITSPLPNVRVLTVGGALNVPLSDDGSTIENTLDVEMVGAIAPNTDIVLIIAPNTLNGFTLALQTAKNLNPFAVSCSWGFPETAVPLSYILDINTVIQSMADLGINVCCASGDAGSSDGATGVNMDFPGSSPSVVCCGGTTLLSASNTYDSNTQETVWNNNATTSATGGGRSVVFPRPNYQSSVVTSPVSRCGPDIVLNGNPRSGVIFRVDDTQYVLGGTSIVSPMVTGLLVLFKCNSFANPLFYRSARNCFHDIVSGNNGAYAAKVGFDLCSGLGSVNGLLLKAAFATASVTLSISPSSLSFNNHTPKQLTLSPATSSASWTSSNVKIATVSNTGSVTPVSDGICNISCSVTAQLVQVTVSGVAILATAATILQTLTVGQTLKLAVATTTPANATARTMTWVSQSPNVASVTQAGVVQGVHAGTAVIVGTLQDVNAAHTSCTVQVV